MIMLANQAVRAVCARQARAYAELTEAR
jgi:hypothetical protein